MSTKDESQKTTSGDGRSDEKTRQTPLDGDFTGFLLSLGQTALIDLGVAPHPETSKLSKDLPQARQTIDILAMLRDKTQGNLTAAEEKLLDGLLYQLRLAFLQAGQSK